MDTLLDLKDELQFKQESLRYYDPEITPRDVFSISTGFVRKWGRVVMLSFRGTATSQWQSSATILSVPAEVAPMRPINFFVGVGTEIRNAIINSSSDGIADGVLSLYGPIANGAEIIGYITYLAANE